MRQVPLGRKYFITNSIKNHLRHEIKKGKTNQNHHSLMLPKERGNHYIC